ncbi:cytochrome P450 [Streptomyces sp. NBC_00247]|uniref:cytochrome P450 n=1 Tax=Streptomyces sp. NBC_00247 TaxID=2975689 RepID=UPI002E28C815|nr:cytochrome P450 [Streptomyces sp. NBC_00247]
MTEIPQTDDAPSPFPFPDGPMSSPPPEFERRRAVCPLSEVTLPTGDRAMLALKHADIQQIMSDDRRFTRDFSDPEAPRLFHNLLMLEDPTIMLNMHGEDHLRLRRILASAFTPRRAAAWRPQVQESIDLLLDEMEKAGRPANLMSFAYKLPTKLTCKMLAIPEEDGEQLLKWVSAWLSFAMPREELDKAAADFNDYVVALARRRRDEPGDALIDHLISARDRDDRLSEDELVSTIRTLIIGGNETIANSISRMTFTLLRQRNLWETLQADRSLIPTAIEELLRHNPPGGGATGLMRLATEDVELVSGAGTVKAGQAVFTPLVAAAYDPEAFPDPETVRFDRPRQPSTMQFGAGRHYCVGVHLARTELELMLTALLDRFPNLRLAEAPEDLPWSEGGYGVTMSELPVTW